MRQALAQFLGLLGEHLSLATDELTLKLNQLLRFLDAEHRMRELECIRNRRLRQRQGALANVGSLMIDTLDGPAGGREITLEHGSAVCHRDPYL